VIVGGRADRVIGRTVVRTLLSTWKDVLERAINFTVFMGVSSVCASL